MSRFLSLLIAISLSVFSGCMSLLSIRTGARINTLEKKVAPQAELGLGVYTIPAPEPIEAINFSATSTFYSMSSKTNILTFGLKAGAVILGSKSIKSINLGLDAGPAMNSFARNDSYKGIRAGYEFYPNYKNKNSFMGFGVGIDGYGGKIKFHNKTKTSIFGLSLSVIYTFP